MSHSAFIEEEYDKRLDLSLWRKVFRYALAYRRYLYPLVVIAMMTAGVDALFNLMTREVIDAVVTRGADVELMPFALLYCGLIVSLCSCVWLFIILAGKIATGVSYDIRREGFARLQELSFSFYDRRPVGWLVARMTSDCQRLSSILAWGSLDIVWGCTLMIGITVIMLWMNWQLALIVLSVIPVLIGVSAYFQKVILRSSRVVRRTNSRLTAAYNEGIMGVYTTKTMVREEANLEEFGGLSTEMYNASVRNALQSAVYLPIVLSLASVGTGVALWVGGVQVIKGVVSIGTLVAFIAYTRQFFDPIHHVARLFAELQHAQASAERIMGLIETEPEIKDSPGVIEAIETQRHGKRSDGTAIDGYPERVTAIEFRNVSFSYKDGQAVLEDFNLEVKASETIALVGPTGGGKTTIVSLLCRFYEPTSGQILFDGVDYRERSLHWLQSNLGIVLQVPHLFSGSIRENMRYGRLDAGEADIVRAARLVNAHDFITNLEKGYDSEVGEGGAKLSTGQKQLVSFARAILADPQIFVMDEATSSVDTETEQLIQKSMARVLEGRTSFVIAHRLSTIRSADRILVVENGRITEAGNHRELIRLRGHYYDLYTNQFTREKESQLLEAAVGE